MIETKRINYTSTPYGVRRYHEDLQALILDGYRLPDDKFAAKARMHFGIRHGITLYRETPDDPLEKLADPKLKRDALIEIAKEDFGIEVPESKKAPAAIKKYIKDTVAAMSVAEEVAEVIEEAVEEVIETEVTPESGADEE